MSALDSMYPTRCYDCLTPIARDELLCDGCKAVYANARAIRDGDTKEGL